MRKSTCQKQAGNEEKNLPSHQIISSSIYAFLQELKGFRGIHLDEGRANASVSNRTSSLKSQFIPLKGGVIAKIIPKMLLCATNLNS